MCGIFGYFGHRNTGPDLVVEGLKKLEYRGYDSWGIAFDSKESISIEKQVGKISDFEGKNLAKSHYAFGHSRWATHGKVTQANAHPHFSEDKKISVVHNGIIENFAELRKELEKEGHIFASDTDTEVIPHLIEKYLEFGAEIAFKKALARLEGRFAVLLMIHGDETMYAARNGSPLIAGIGENEFFLASDIPAFLSETRNVSYLDDEEMVIINQNGISFQNFLTGQPVEKRIVEIEWDVKSADKGDFDHFMIKEIFDQKDTLYRAIDQEDSQIQGVAEAILKARGSFLLGCGTAGKVCHAGDYFLSSIAHRHTNFIPASEFSNYHHFLTDKTLLIAVSQSGETADLLEAIEVGKKKGCQILSLVNVEGSSIQRASDYCFLINAGPEKAVASTKATTSQLALLLLISYAVAGKLDEGKRVLLKAAAQVNEMLNPRYLEHIHTLAKKIVQNENIYIMGRGANFPIALEAAIKIQEVSYIHAEGFAAGELKHGPIALITDNVPVIAISARGTNHNELISNAIEVKSRGAYVIGVGPENNGAFDYWLKVPEAGEAQAILNLIPVQILAYYLAVERGLNPDMPRNLAKSVTVK